MERDDVRGQGQPARGSCGARPRACSRWPSSPDAWEAPTMPPEWQVRDVIGHLVDTTEAYFVGFDAARERTGGAGRVRACRAWRRGWTSRRRRCGAVPQAELMDARPRRTSTKMMEIVEALGRGRVDRAHRPALLHGSAAGVLLPGVPADGLRRALVGHPAGDRPRPRAGRRRGRPAGAVHVRPVAGDDRGGRTREPFERRHPGHVRARTPATTGCDVGPDGFDVRARRRRRAAGRCSSSTRRASC